MPRPRTASEGRVLTEHGRILLVYHRLTTSREAKRLLAILDRTYQERTVVDLGFDEHPASLRALATHLAPDDVVLILVDPDWERRRRAPQTDSSPLDDSLFHPASTIRVGVRGGDGEGTLTIADSTWGADVSKLLDALAQRLDEGPHRTRPESETAVAGVEAQGQPQPSVEAAPYTGPEAPRVPDRQGPPDERAAVSRGDSSERQVAFRSGSAGAKERGPGTSKLYHDNIRRRLRVAPPALSWWQRLGRRAKLTVAAVMIAAVAAAVVIVAISPPSPPRDSGSSASASSPAATTSSGPVSSVSDTSGTGNLVNTYGNLKATYGVSSSLANNVFYDYWNNGGSGHESYLSWSGETHQYYNVSASSDGATVTASISGTTDPNAEVMFPQSAVDVYTQAQGDAFVSSGAHGP